LLKVDEPKQVDKLQIIMEHVWITEEIPNRMGGRYYLPYTQEGGPVRMW
jgi:hypothetical protein